MNRRLQSEHNFQLFCALPSVVGSFFLSRNKYKIIFILRSRLDLFDLRLDSKLGQIIDPKLDPRLEPGLEPGLDPKLEPRLDLRVDP